MTSTDDIRVVCRAIEHLDPDRWNECVRQSPHGSVFHRYEVLRALTEHSKTTFHGLVGYRRGAPVGVFPLFELSRGPLTGVFSPPPRLAVPALGPALLYEPGETIADQSEINRQFLLECRRWLEDQLRPSYLRVKTSPGFEDVEFFYERGTFTTTPQFTYVVDLDRDRGDLLRSFSRDARSNIRSVEDDDYEVRVGATGSIERNVSELQRRYAEQGLSFSPTESYVEELYDRLPSGSLRPYELTKDGAFLSGMLVLEGEETAYRWLGGAKPTADIPANDLLDWHIMCDAIERGLSRYDLVGANVPRLCDYKSKFNPELAPYQLVRDNTLGADVLAWIYRRARKAGVSSIPL